MLKELLDHGQTHLLKELLDREHKHLNYFFKHIDLDAFEMLFTVLKNRKGVIILTGIGKSGLVAKKIAATMTSTNTGAIYISPINALHGDLGIVRKDDIFIFLSKSGESEELFTIIPSLRNKGVTLVAVVSAPTSRLAKVCDLVFHLPLQRELCPYNMVPTTSTTIQMIFGDILSIALMEQNKLSLDDYALNHPAGSIGKKITLKVRDLMIVGENLPQCKPDDTLYEKLVELSNKRCGCILIINPDRTLAGIFTDGDLRRALQNFGSEALNKKMKEVMSLRPRTATPELFAVDAIKMMEYTHKNEISVLPVLNEDKQVLGLIKLHDIIQSGIS